MKKALLFLVACLALRVLFVSFPSLAEGCYSRTFFVAYRCVWDSTLGQSPVALVYVFLGLLPAWWLVKMVYFFIKKKKNANKNLHTDTYDKPEPLIKKEVKHFLPTSLFNFLTSFTHTQEIGEKTPTQWLFGIVGRVFSVIAYIIGSFLLFWGYNYCRIPVETQLKIQVADSLTLPELRAEAQRITVECAVIRDSLTERKGVIKIKNKARSAKKAVQIQFDFDSLETETRTNLEAVLADLNFPTSGAVRGRLLYPEGILLRNNTAGVYLPWVGEGHIDAGLHPLQIPFTLSHEMSHGYGFTDEGVCNFLAYLACERSKNPFVKYSGRLSHWRYVFSALHKKNTPAYLWERAKIPRGMHEDIKNIRKKMDEYPDLLKGVQASTYDSYLKIQGVKEGLDSYERMVALVIAWRKR